MENISANTLFHFTGELNNLKNILAHRRFYVRYSLENFESLIELDKQNEIALPMTCFCDILLSQTKEHTKKYGTYAIGMDKEWAMKNQISPVVYAHPRSVTAQILNEILKDLPSFFEIKTKGVKKTVFNFDTLLSELSPEKRSLITSKFDALKGKIIHFIKYVKPYKGKIYRDHGEDGYLKEEQLFYDEREWRYVPDKDFFQRKLPKSKIFDNKPKTTYEAKYYKNKISRRAINMNLAKYLDLPFEHKDVKFIIVKNESEIPEMIDFIENSFDGKLKNKEIQLLTSRLISMSQIRENV